MDKKEKPILVSDWFRIADETDMPQAKLSFAFSDELDGVCFSCQQAAEKYLKGYLFAKTGKEPKHTHDVAALREQCLEFDSRFDTAEDACDFLAQLISRTRYPGYERLTPEDMRLAIRYAGEVRELAPIRELQAEIGYERERFPLGSVADAVKTEAVKSMLKRGLPLSEIANIAEEFGVDKREVFQICEATEKSVITKIAAYAELGLDKQSVPKKQKHRDENER